MARGNGLEPGNARIGAIILRRKYPESDVLDSRRLRLSPEPDRRSRLRLVAVSASVEATRRADLRRQWRSPIDQRVRGPPSRHLRRRHLARIRSRSRTSDSRDHRSRYPTVTPRLAQLSQRSSEEAGARNQANVRHAGKTNRIPTKDVRLRCPSSNGRYRICGSGIRSKKASWRCCRFGKPRQQKSEVVTSSGSPQDSIQVFEAAGRQLLRRTGVANPFKEVQNPSVRDPVSKLQADSAASNPHRCCGIRSKKFRTPRSGI